MAEKINVEELLKKQTYQIIYKVIFKEAAWVVGTKNDPKKEFGTFKCSVVIPKEDGTYYTKDMAFFVDKKEALPTTNIEPFTPVYALFEFNKYSPEASGRFVKVLD